MKILRYFSSGYVDIVSSCLQGAGERGTRDILSRGHGSEVGFTGEGWNG